MLCPNCGTLNSDSAAQCQTCGFALAGQQQGGQPTQPPGQQGQPPPPPGWGQQPPAQQGAWGQQPPPPPQGAWGQPPPAPWGGQGPAQGPPPPNYLIHSILATVLCCLPAGIVGIVFASQVNTKWAQGDFAGATKSSNMAKLWTWISFGLGLASVVFVIFLAILGGGTSEF